MTPRSGLFVALVGLVMAVPCLTTLFLLRDWHDVWGSPVGDGLMILGLGFILLLDLGALLGLIVLVVGLVMAAILALTKQRSTPA